MDKGKGKGKISGKNIHNVEYDMYWFSQGKNGKGTNNKGTYKGNVNVYGMEMCLLEFLDVYTSSQSMWTASPAASASEAKPHLPVAWWTAAQQHQPAQRPAFNSSGVC